MSDLTKRIANLERLKRESDSVLSPVLDYCRDNGVGETGKSMTQALIAEHSSQRDRIAELGAEVERLKEWCVTGEKQLKGRQDYARDQLQRAESAEQRVKELERLLRYAEEQALLPQISFEGARELINDIQKDATDAGGCYEVSTNLLDQLFERYTDRGACVLLNKFAIKQQIEVLEKFESITGAVANHWCDKEQAGYFWMHSEVMAELKRLREELEGLK